MKEFLTASAVAALGVVFYFVFISKPIEIAFDFSGPNGYPRPPTPYDNVVLTEDDIRVYERDGFLLKHNFFQGDNLEKLVSSAWKEYNSWSPLDFVNRYSYRKLSMQAWRYNPEFAQVAFESMLPSISAKLLQEQESIRLLKDGFFGFAPDGATGCGFHVDDLGFWPAKEDTTGVNVWIALSSMRVLEGGGIRVVNQSLVSKEVFEECKAVIRGASSYSATCNMEKLSPSCHDSMMEASVIYDMEPGDILIWDRWTFHRGEPFLVNNTEPKLRYSIRYIPSTATAKGVIHPSVAQGENSIVRFTLKYGPVQFLLK